MRNRARVTAAMSVIAATYLLFSTPSVRGAERLNNLMLEQVLPATSIYAHQHH